MPIEYSSIVLSTASALVIEPKILLNKKVLVEKILPRIEIRGGGNLAGQGFYLPSEFDWALGKDSYGEFVLVPLERKA